MTVNINNLVNLTDIIICKKRKQYLLYECNNKVQKQPRLIYNVISGINACSSGVEGSDQKDA